MANTLAQMDEDRLISLANMDYVGAFRLPHNKFGNSDSTYAEGQIAYNPEKHSLFLVGHRHQEAIAEFAIPKLGTSRNIGELPMSAVPLQKYTQILNRAPITHRDQPMDRISGLLYHQGKLIVNAYEYYDAPANNVLTTLVVEDASNLEGSAVRGFYSLQGAAHAAGWMSPLPEEWAQRLEARWLSGSSSGMPIISRFSVGPSAFLFDPDQLGRQDPVPTQRLLDFSLKNPLSGDLYSEQGDDLWNHLSRAVYGFIVPGTDSYLTLGHGGGHSSGICYKCVPDGRKQPCYGYCARDPRDYHLRYWLWNVHDLLLARQGRMRADAIRPYAYGNFIPPFPATEFGGGSFDPQTGRLYLTLRNADTLQTRYGAPPIVVVYQFK